MTRFHSYAKSPEGGCPVLPGSKSVLSERSPRFVRERLGKQWYFDHSHIYIYIYPNMRMGKNVVNSDLGLQYAGSQRFAGVVELLEHFHRQKATDGQSEDRRCKCLKLFWDGWLVIWNVFYFSIYCEFHNSNISQLSQLTKSYFSEGWRKTTKQMGFGDINWWNIEAKSSRSIFGYGIPWSP